LGSYGRAPVQSEDAAALANTCDFEFTHLQFTDFSVFTQKVVPFPLAYEPGHFLRRTSLSKISRTFKHIRRNEYQTFCFGM
jgi:hypothetical protein